MRIRQSICLLVLTGVLLSSCLAHKNEPPYLELIPGECITGYSLYIWPPQSERGSYYSFGMVVHYSGLDIIKQGLGERTGHSIPSKETLSQFGENGPSVKKKYLELLEDMYDDCPTAIQRQATVFFTDKLLITADKEFAGTPPGEDISGLFGCKTRWGTQLDLDGDFISVVSLDFNDYSGGGLVGLNSNLIPNRSLPSGGTIGVISTDKYEVIDEGITLTFFAPLKKVMLLTWLNDRISSPEAPMPFEEDTLTCTVKLKKNLKLPDKILAEIE